MFSPENDELEKQLEQVKAAARLELDAKEEDAQALRQELARANELLQSKHRVLLSDDEIAQFSPGAATMSRLLKSGNLLF